MSDTTGTIEKLFAGYRTRLRNFRNEFGKEAINRMIPLTPVRTGLLQASYEYKLNQQDIEFLNNAPYAYFVEYGTEKIAPRAMMRTALLEADDIAEVAMERASK